MEPSVWPHSYPRLTVASTVLLLFAAGGMLMHSESQVQVLLLLAGFLLAFVLADQTVRGRELLSTFARHESTANWTAFLGAVSLAIAFHRDHYALLMLATVAMYATACTGLNLQFAFAGIPNFAGAAFFVVGSYSAAVLTTWGGIPHLGVLVISGLVSGALGVILIMPVLRTRGHYAALVTIAFGLLLRTLLEVNDTFGGPQGMKIKGFVIFGYDFGRVTSIGAWPVSFYSLYALLGIALFALAFDILRRIERSWIGIALDSVRTDETAASVFGLSIARWKIFGFLVGNFIIGVAGAVYGMMNGFVTPTGAGLGESLLMLSIIVLGGLGNPWGAIVASTIILVIPEKLQAIQEYRLLMFSILVLVILRFRPAGILPRRLRDLSRLLPMKGRSA